MRQSAKRPRLSWIVIAAFVQLIAIGGISPWANQPPRIEGISISPIPTTGGATVHVTAQATDPEGLDLTYRWQTEDGTLTNADDNDAELDWTLPAGEGNFMISLRVVDPSGGLVFAERLVPIGPVKSYESLKPTDGQPTRIALDSNGDLWVTDAARSVLSHVSADGALIDEFAVGAKPLGIAVAGDGTLWVGEDGLDRVAHYSAAGALLGVAGSGVGQVKMPNAIAINPSDGALYVVDTLKDRVLIFSSDGTYRSAIATSNFFDFPVDIAINPNLGEIYVVNQGSAVIFALTMDGVLDRRLGGLGLADNQFGRPQGIAVGADNRLLVLDAYQNNIKILESTGEHVATFGYMGKGKGAMRTPQSVAVAPGERVFITSMDGGEIEVFAYLSWSQSQIGSNGMVIF